MNRVLAFPTPGQHRVNRDGRRVLAVFKVLGVGIGAKVLAVLSGSAFRLAGGGARTLRTARPQRRTRRTERTPRQPGLFMTKGRRKNRTIGTIKTLGTIGTPAEITASPKCPNGPKSPKSPNGPIKPLSRRWSYPRQSAKSAVTLAF
jgi:hypothetical protein